MYHVAQNSDIFLSDPSRQCLPLTCIVGFGARLPQARVIKAALTLCQLSAGPRAEICDHAVLDPVGTNAMFLSL